MVSLLDQVTEGAGKIPDLMVLYGPDGVGKSTFASKAPAPIFLDIEKGSKRLKVKRFDKARNFRDVLQFLSELHEQAHNYQTLVVDSLSELEVMIFAQTCLDQGVDNIEVVGGGFNKGYTVALKYWELFRQAINTLQDRRGMNVVMLAHADVKTFTDPNTNSAYDRYQLKLDKKSAALIRQWVDFVGFANYHTYTKGKENAAKHKAYGDGTRTLYTERRPAYDAKNRLGLPLQLELDYAAYAVSAHADEASKAAQIRQNMEELLKDSPDEALKKLVRETVVKAADNLTDLMLLQERLRTRLQKEVDNAIAGN